MSTKRTALLLLATTSMTLPQMANAGTVTAGKASISLAQDGDCGLGASPTVFTITAPTRSSYPTPSPARDYYTGNYVGFHQGGTVITSAKVQASPDSVTVPSLDTSKLAQARSYVYYAESTTYVTTDFYAPTTTYVQYRTLYDQPVVFDPSQVDPSCPGDYNPGPAPVIDVTPAGDLPDDGVIEISANERLVGLEASDFTISGGIVESVVQNDTLGHSFSVTITPSASTVDLTLPAGAAKDVTGNNSPAVSRSYSAVPADTTAPTGYSASFDDAAMNASEVGSASFTMAGAEVGATYAYSITSSGGGSAVTGSGTVSATDQQVTGLNLSGLADGTLTLSLTLTDAASNVGSAVSATASKDTVAPNDIETMFSAQWITSANVSGYTVELTNATAGATYTLTATPFSGGGATVSVSGTATGSPSTTPAMDLSGLPDGYVNFKLSYTDAAGNAAADRYWSMQKDVTAPSGYGVAFDADSFDYAAWVADSMSFTVTGGEAGSYVDYVVTSSGGGSTSGTASSTAADQVITINDSFRLSEGTLTIEVKLRDRSGNIGAVVTDTAELVFDSEAPSGYSVSFPDTYVNASESTSTSFVMAGAEVGATYNYSFTTLNSYTSSTGTLPGSAGATVTGSGTVTAADQTVGGIDISSLGDGQLRVVLTLTDAAGNVGEAVNSGGAPAFKDTSTPASAANFPRAYINSANLDSSAPYISVPTSNSTYSYTLTSSGGGASQSGSGTLTGVSGSSAAVPGVNVAAMADGTLTLELQITDAAGNGPFTSIATTLKDTVAPSPSVQWTKTQYNADDIATAGLRFTNVEAGDTYSWRLNGTTVTGTGTFSSSDEVVYIDLTGYADGTYWVTASVTDPQFNKSADVARPTEKDTVGPAPTLAFPSPTIAWESRDAVTLTAPFNCEVNRGCDFELSITSSGGGSPVTASGSKAWNAPSNDIGPLDLSGLAAGTLTATLKVTDTEGNHTTVEATATLAGDATAPTGYSASFDDALLNASEATNAAFTMAGAEVGATYAYSITSSGGGSAVTGSGTVASTGEQLSGLDLSGLGDGTLTLSLTLTDAAGNAGSAVTASTIKDATGPSGYDTYFDVSNIAADKASSSQLNLRNAGVGDSFTYRVTSSGGGKPVTGSGTVASNPQITTVDLRGLADGALTLEMTVTDSAGNVGATVMSSGTLDTTAPGAPVISAASLITSANAANFSFDASSLEIGARVEVTISGGSKWVAQSLADNDADTQSFTGFDLSGFDDGMIMIEVTAVDAVGNRTTSMTTVDKDASGPSGHMVAMDAASYDDATLGNASIVVSDGELASTYAYSITSSGGGAAVTGSGEIGSSNHIVTGIDLSSLNDGTLTVSVVLADAYGNSSAAVTDTATLQRDIAAPTGYSVSFVDPLMSSVEWGNFNLTGAEVGTTYAWTISSSGGGSIAGSGTVTAASQLIDGIALGTLGEGELTLSLTLTDAAGNIGTAATAIGTLDRTLWPASYTPVPIDGGDVTAYTLALSGLEIGATYRVSVRSQTDGTQVDGSDFVATATEMASPALDASGVSDGAVWAMVMVTDPAGNSVTTYSTTTKDVGAPAGYAVTLGAASYDDATLSSASFEMTGAEVGATFDYTITSSGGGTPVAGNGTVTSAAQTVSGIDLSPLGDGTLTLSLTLTDRVGNEGLAATTTAALQRDVTAPTGYAVAFGGTLISAADAASVSFDMTGAEIGATYAYEISSSGGGTAVTGTGTITASSQQVSGLDLSGLGDGTLTLSMTLTDAAGNVGDAATGTATKDTGAPIDYGFDLFDTVIASANAAAYNVPVLFASDPAGYTVDLEFASTGGGSLSESYAVSGSQDQRSVDLAALGDGDVTMRFRLTDAAGNVGAWVSAALIKDTVGPVISHGALSVFSGVLETTISLDDTSGLYLDYRVTSSNGGTPITGTIPADSSTSFQAFVGSLPSGILTLTLEGADAYGNRTSVSSTIDADLAAPTGYAIAFADSDIAANEAAGITLELTGLESDSTYSVTLISESGGTPIVLRGAASGSTHTINGIDVSGLAGGTLMAYLVVSDAAGNGGDEVYATAAKDTAVPETIVTAPSGAGLQPFALPLSFGEPVTGLTAGDFLVANAGVTLSGGPADYVLTVTPTGAGDVTIGLPAGAAQDVAGNPTAAVDAITIAIDAVVPEPMVSTPPASVNGPFDLSMSFGEPVTGLEIADFIVENATITLSGGPADWTITVTPTGDGDIAIRLPEGAAQDASGNPTKAFAADIAVAYDVTAPVPMVSPPAGEGLAAFDLPITFGEDVFGLTASDFIVANASVILTGGPSSYVLTVTPSGAGDVTIALPEGAGEDGAGNPTAAIVTITIAIDAVLPEPVVSVPPTSVNGPFDLSLSFGEPVIGLEASDFIVENATIALSGGPADWIITVTPTGGGDIAIRLPEGAAQDASGNPTKAFAADIAVAFDDEAPTATLSAAPGRITGPFDLAIAFSEAVSGLALDDFTLVNASVSDLRTTDASHYVVTVTPSAMGAFSVALAADAVVDGAGNGNPASAAYAGQYIDEAAVRKETVSLVAGFMGRRGDQIMSAEPDLGSMLLDQGAGGSVAANGEGANVRLAFNGTLNLSDLGVRLGEAHAKRIGLWLRGSYVHADGGATDSDLWMVHGGAHYRFDDKALLGLMGQYDDAALSDDTAGSAAEGTGWMVGPYFAARLAPRLVVDGRAAWGQSDNEVSPYGTYVDGFDATRSLYRFGVTGDLDLSKSWSLRPHARLIRFREESEAYVDSQQVSIPAVSVEVGRLAFGPTIERRIEANERHVQIAPRFGIEGLWDFDSERRADGVAGFDGSSDDFRARLKAGVTIGTGQVGVDVDTFYDGIGANDYSAYGLSVKLRTGF
ncbi:Ig-like domain-containing protein [Sphingomicrobium arenosum]|uniref:Ig-like domain-containing protein n=1 Tax=Sphingomicrobium arenosum TaxID=2233861 RepID=UPI00224043EE|nr:Ig-like domain-containing protein [Sphingomicrobium arenosum]